MPALEAPQQSYFPSAKTRLIIRFEDFGSSLIEPPPKRPQQRKGTGKDPALKVKEENGRLVLEGATTQKGSPQEQVTSSDDYTHEVGGILPVRATFQSNGIRMADTLTLELRYSDLPVDPRTVRACAVEFYLGCVSADDYARGVSGESTNGGPLNLIPDEYVDANGKARTNLRFQGWVDDWDAEWGDDDVPMVRLECTDNTRIFIEQLAPPKLVVDAKKPLDEAFANYLANFPQFVGMGVRYYPPGAEPPVLEKVLAKTSYRPTLGPSPSQGGDKLTVWDYLTDVAGSVGHVVRVVGTDVVIQRPRTLYSDKFTGRDDDPFTGRVLPSGRVLERRLMVYGRNVESMRFRRRYTAQAPQNVECRCYSARRKKTLVARYPLKGDRVLKASPGNASDEKWLVVRVSGIEDEETLRLVAQATYEGIGRNELEATVRTRVLGSFGGSNEDPDLLDMQAGDALDVEVTRDDTFSLGQFEESMATDAESFLLELGYSPKFAAAYAKAVQNIGFRSTFRVRRASFDWDIEDGVSIQVEGVNYIEARVDKQLPEGEEQEPPERDAEPVTVRVE